MRVDRIRSDFWVSAQLRRCAIEGVDAVLRRRGAAEAGAIFVTLDWLDGRVDLFGPAPPSLIGEESGDRVFVPIMKGQPGFAVAERMAREIRYDPDLWWLSLDDRQGRTFFDLAPPTP